MSPEKLKQKLRQVDFDDGYNRQRTFGSMSISPTERGNFDNNGKIISGNNSSRRQRDKYNAIMSVPSIELRKKRTAANID